MDVGIGLPHLGSLADPDAIRTVAIAAERAGMASVWAMDRLLRPVQPRSFGYPGRTDGVLPAAQGVVLDPLVALTVAATVTERVRLGTDVLVAPWYPPVLLARSLAAIDQVSRGRLVAGLGLGWSTDEFDAVGAPMTGRGRRMDEILDVLRAVWTDSVVDITTTREHIAPSAMGLKPAQPGGPPVLLAATGRAGLERIARSGDGWLPFGSSLAEIAAGWTYVQRRASELGRDPDEMRLVVRADARCTTDRLDSSRSNFLGSCGQVRDDLAALADLGVHEVILDLHQAVDSVDELLQTAHHLAQPALGVAA
jgi:probable F420-dependent oxidoreductase